MLACAWRSSLTICFSAVWVNSMCQVKSALQLFQADGGFVALQDGDAKKVVLAIFEILPNGFPRVVTLTASRLPGQFFQPVFEFWFQSNTQHSRSPSR